MKKTLLFVFIGVSILSCSSSSDWAVQATNDSSQIDRVIRDSIKNIIFDLSNGNNELPDDYLTYFGFRDWYRWPLIFPYSLNSIDVKDNGFLYDERLALHISDSDEGVDRIYLGQITKFSFNKEILIAEIRNDDTEKYQMFRFSDKEISNYSSLNAMVKESSTYGDMIFDSLVTLEMYNLFFTK